MEYSRHILAQSSFGRGSTKAFIKKFAVAIAVWLVLVLIALLPLTGFAQEETPFDRPSTSEEQLPEPRAHPLPASLAHWQDDNQQGDYFSEIQPTPIGYLVWSQLPVTVFVEPALTTGNVAAIERSQAWVEAVQQAVQEWNIYLPLQRVTEAETADIAIWRSTPPLQLEPRQNESDPLLRLPRARSAETRYHLFVDRPVDAPAKISHRFTIHITPNQTIEYLKATARHEMGHALGIWGHSPLETDALYFSQVRTSPPISDRDINTLKRIYQQPTQIGWELP
jgi:predicted Zn-dependent protease